MVTFEVTFEQKVSYHLFGDPLFLEMSGHVLDVLHEEPHMFRPQDLDYTVVGSRPVLARLLKLGVICEYFKESSGTWYCYKESDPGYSELFALADACISQAEARQKTAFPEIDELSAEQWAAIGNWHKVTGKYLMRCSSARARPVWFLPSRVI